MSGYGFDRRDDQWENMRQPVPTPGIGMGGYNPFWNPNAFAAFGIAQPGGSPFGQPNISGLDRAGIGDAIGRAAGGIGEKIGEGVDWLTDPERGLNRQLLLSGLIGTGANIYSAYKQGKEEDRRRKQEEANARARLPAYRSIIDRLMADIEG